ncbi:hypothetical protein D9611_013167 [Ephemerocybe angulata]|uniref:Uncharacterized protein n=1 Tax=Ephemerocybe angulata TaxID=980116 RepID=A0A8H5FA09_9AGAR|nr:hypothetical protein D9611_013167 [Tulosesus angulatus]
MPANFYFDTGQSLISIVRAVPERPMPGFQVSPGAKTEGPPFNRLTPTRKSQLPAHGRTPKHKTIGRLATIHSPSIKTPIARCFSAHFTHERHLAEPRAPGHPEPNETRVSGPTDSAIRRPSHPPLAARSQINPTSSKHTHEYIDTRRQFTRPRAAPHNTRSTSTSHNCDHEPSRASQNRRKRETRVCLRRMGLRERPDMDAHVGGYC